MTDTISRADAVKAVQKELVCDGRHETHDKTCRFIADVLLSALPSAEAKGDLISRQWLLDLYDIPTDGDDVEWKVPLEVVRQNILDAPSAEAVQGWIPCSERLPEDIKPVIVTWKNTDPASYYQYIVGKHFIGTAHYYRGKWYWYSSVTEDLLAEYGKCDTEEFDEAIEAVAWMPLPTPYKGGDTE